MPRERVINRIEHFFSWYRNRLLESRWLLPVIRNEPGFDSELKPLDLKLFHAISLSAVLHKSLYITALFVALCAATILDTQNVAAQESVLGMLEGRVLDSESGLTLPGATILLKLGGRSVSGQVSDERGAFVFHNLSQGTYVLETSFLGFESRTDTLSLPYGGRFNILLKPSRTFLDEILIETQRAPGEHFIAGLTTIRPSDLSRVPMPDVSYDLAGYLLTLPGVVSMGDRGGQMFIRGGTPTQNLVLVDGMRIFQPFHIVGFYSAFPADIISYADVYAGGFSARYGGRISSVIDIKTKNGNKQRVEASASIAPFLSGVQISVPVVPGQVSLMLSARESVIDRLSGDFLGKTIPFRFGDRYAKLHAYLSQTSSLTLTALQTHDEGNLQAETDIPEDVIRKSTWKNRAYGAKFTFLPQDQAVMTELAVYYSSLESRYRLTQDELRVANVSELSMNIGFSYLLGPDQIHFGIFGNTSFFDYELGKLGTKSASGVTSVGSFIEGSFQLGRRIRLEPGARLEIFSRGLNNSFGPRARIIFLPHGSGSHNQFSLAWGRYHQQITGLNNEQDVSDVFTIWAASPKGKRVPRAVHYIGAWKGRPYSWLELTLEVYHKDLSNLSFPVFDEVINKLADFSTVDGLSQGYDARIEVNYPSVFLSLSYSRSRVEYHRPLQRATGVFRPILGETVHLEELTFNPPHDRRRQVNAMAQYRLGKRKLGVRWQFGSGLPFTQVNGYYTGLGASIDPDSNDHITDAGRTFVSRSDPYAARLPTYHRLDVTYERKIEYSKLSLRMQAGVINVYGRRNIFEYNIFTGNRVDQLPLIPSLGLRVDLK